MDLTQVITPELADLRSKFQERGFDLRLVGGVVRDLVRGVQPKDVDLCTDATPDEQIEIYVANRVRYFETGIAHGTITARAGHELYEITSLRTEANHDGRHADVTYTRDWIEDLNRRDLTFNAMALTFDGDLIDPFNGAEDLSNGIVRFVGSPDDRMREDYLRILRWLRFHGRIAPASPLDPETVEAAVRQAEGLDGISRERVWMEFAKIISGEGGPGLVEQMYEMGIAEHIGLPTGSIVRLKTVHQFTRNPVSLLHALLSLNESDTIVNTQEYDMATVWKWSSEERDFAFFLNRYDFHLVVGGVSMLDRRKHLLAHDARPLEWVVELALLDEDPEGAEVLRNWKVPAFPVRGSDLLYIGMKSGPEMGEALKALKLRWADSNYALTKDELMASLKREQA